MKSFQLAFNILLIGFIAVCSSQTADYCSTKLCPNNDNIACNNNGKFPANCPAGTQLVDMIPFRNLIVDYHNEKRDLIASGKGNFTASKRMATIKWDEELENMAGLNLKKFACDLKMEHDTCRNTDRFHYSGQNLAYMGYSGTYSMETLLKIFLDMWFNENIHCTQSMINSYPSSSPNPAVGHFTAMITEKNIAMGCASVQISSNPTFCYFACNYAATNIVSCPIYVTSTNGPASGCTSGTNPKYPNLCSESEKIDPNNFDECFFGN